jgi:hypothetical protein
VSGKKPLAAQGHRFGRLDDEKKNPAVTLRRVRQGTSQKRGKKLQKEKRSDTKIGGFSEGMANEVS